MAHIVCVYMQVYRQPIPVSRLVVEDLADGESRLGGSFRGIKTVKSGTSSGKHVYIITFVHQTVAVLLIIIKFNTGHQLIRRFAQGNYTTPSTKCTQPLMLAVYNFLNSPHGYY